MSSDRHALQELSHQVGQHARRDRERRRRLLRVLPQGDRGRRAREGALHAQGRPSIQAAFLTL